LAMKNLRVTRHTTSRGDTPAPKEYDRGWSDPIHISLTGQVRH
jgi:hypothetical protein